MISTFILHSWAIPHQYTKGYTGFVPISRAGFVSLATENVHIIPVTRSKMQYGQSFSVSLAFLNKLVYAPNAERQVNRYSVSLSGVWSLGAMHEYGYRHSGTNLE